MTKQVAAAFFSSSWAPPSIWNQGPASRGLCSYDPWGHRRQEVEGQRTQLSSGASLWKDKEAALIEKELPIENGPRDKRAKGFGEAAQGVRESGAQLPAGNTSFPHA